MTVTIVDNVPQKIQGSQDQFYEAHMNKILLRTSNGFVQLQAGNYEIQYLRDQPCS